MDYELTDLGHSVVGLLDAILTWSQDHATEIIIARQHYDHQAGHDQVAAS